MNDFKVYYGFINRYGEVYDNIRNIAFKLEKTMILVLLKMKP